MNVLFFKGLWLRNSFAFNKTKVEKFYETAERPVDAQFMNALGYFYYAESLELDAKIIRIPYIVSYISPMNIPIKFKFNFTMITLG